MFEKIMNFIAKRSGTPANSDDYSGKGLVGFVCVFFVTTVISLGVILASAIGVNLLLGLVLFFPGVILGLKPICIGI